MEGIVLERLPSLSLTIGSMSELLETSSHPHNMEISYSTQP